MSSDHHSDGTVKLMPTAAHVGRVNGKLPYENEDVAYQVNVTTDPGTNAYLSALLNAGVERFDADQPALNYYERNYSPNGEIDIPVMTLHTTRDPAIPFSHEATFAKAVADSGRSAQLVQRPIDRWGHCTFTSSEVDSAFNDLVGWVDTGQRP